MERFIDNGDNTVTDTKTNLVWTKNTVASDVNYEHAEKAVSELGDGWRLPTVDELQSLVDRQKYRPAINTDVFIDTENDWYWTSTPCAWNDAARWVVVFNIGAVTVNHRCYNACVRAVKEHNYMNKCPQCDSEEVEEFDNGDCQCLECQWCWNEEDE